MATAQTPPDTLHNPFPLGRQISGGNFTGTVWVQGLLTIEDPQPIRVGNVTFAPGARSHWHRHPAGQSLLVLDGVGYYQERGSAVRVLRRGDTAQCAPDVEHWHGAAADQWFVQQAMSREHPRGRVLWGAPVTDEQYQRGSAQEAAERRAVDSLTNRYRLLAAIAAHNTLGDQERLAFALHDALDAGITINECTEVLVHLYAYTGFPRSIQGLKTLMHIVETGDREGLLTLRGRGPSAIRPAGTRYDRGKAVLDSLVGRTTTRSDYGAFAPVIDQFLKEHLFADIFERDVLSYADREVVTLSALTTLGGVDPMLAGHTRIALGQGISQAQLIAVYQVLENIVGRPAADTARRALRAQLSAR